MEEIRSTLVNPEGVVSVAAVNLCRHPGKLEGKTVLLYWNGKHNGNVFLERIGELLAEKVQGTRIIKSWEVVPESAQSKKSTKTSAEFADKLARLKPDISIGSQGD
ncbi:hypothetical protein ACFLXT_04565 [Chloroflexota bacterium]